MVLQDSNHFTLLDQSLEDSLKGQPKASQAEAQLSWSQPQPKLPTPKNLAKPLDPRHSSVTPALQHSELGTDNLLQPVNLSNLSTNDPNLPDSVRNYKS